MSNFWKSKFENDKGWLCVLTVYNDIFVDVFSAFGFVYDFMKGYDER